MASPFLSIEDIQTQREELLIKRENVRCNKIDFSFPEGFNDIPIIEIARALQCSDWMTNTDSFDLWYDVMKQLLAGKAVYVLYKNDLGEFETINSFMFANRYSDPRAVEMFEQFPIMINWLVGRVAFELEKKFPLSLEDIKALKRENKEPLNTKSKSTKRN